MSTPSLPSEFARFLVAAKRATYAGQSDEATVAPLLLDSKQLEYRDVEFFYRDIYVGMVHFVGMETVYLSDRAIWSMSYSGGVLQGVERSAIRPLYSFLRTALTAVPDRLPLRGPELLEQDAMRYTSQCDGTIERFHGVEAIHLDNECVYRLHFGGGRLA